MRAKNAKGAANAWASEEGRAAAEDERGATVLISHSAVHKTNRAAREVTRTRNKAFCASAKKPTGQGGGRNTLPWL